MICYHFLKSRTPIVLERFIFFYISFPNEFAKLITENYSQNTFCVSFILLNESENIQIMLEEVKYL